MNNHEGVVEFSNTFGYVDNSLRQRTKCGKKQWVNLVETVHLFHTVHYSSGGGGKQNGNGTGNSDLAAIKSQLTHTATTVEVQEVKTEVVEIKSKMVHLVTKTDLKSESNRILKWLICLSVTSVGLFVLAQVYMNSLQN